MIRSSICSSPRKLGVPVLFLVFNRPDVTARVFDAIRNAQPARLYIASDGPREGVNGEVDRVHEVRRICSEITWPCEIKTLFRNSNIGCKRAVSEAINWFFDNEECGIILEDDCLPHPDFFSFCEALLVRYANDVRVSVITGNNFQSGTVWGDGSYYFSNFNHVWGWASWRRAWRLYDVGISFWPHWKRSREFRSRFPNVFVRVYWSIIFDRVYAGSIDTWDYQWTACLWHHGGLTATPNVNLVSNIGFGESATHTTDAEGRYAALSTGSLGELVYVKDVVLESDADTYIFESHFCGGDLKFPRVLLIIPKKMMAGLVRRLKGRFR